MSENNSFPEDDYNASEDYYSRHRDESEDYYEDSYYPDDYYDEYQYQDYGYESEDTWFYEWRGHYSYDKPTLYQKVAWVLMDIKDYVIFKVKGGSDSIPF